MNWVWCTSTSYSHLMLRFDQVLENCCWTLSDCSIMTFKRASLSQSQVDLRLLLTKMWSVIWLMTIDDVDSSFCCHLAYSWNIYRAVRLSHVRQRHKWHLQRICHIFRLVVPLFEDIRDLKSISLFSISAFEWFYKVCLLWMQRDHLSLALSK